MTLLFNRHTFYFFGVDFSGKTYCFNCYGELMFYNWLWNVAQSRPKICSPAPKLGFPVVIRLSLRLTVYKNFSHLVDSLLIHKWSFKLETSWPGVIHTASRISCTINSWLINTKSWICFSCTNQNVKYRNW